MQVYAIRSHALTSVSPIHELPIHARTPSNANAGSCGVFMLGFSLQLRIRIPHSGHITQLVGTISRSARLNAGQAGFAGRI
jgi:hypothetical protein